MFKKAIPTLKIIGLSGVWELIKSKYSIFLRKIDNYQVYFEMLNGKSGIEIGGPSKIFKKGDILPIYPIINGLDGCNFRAKSYWGDFPKGDPYYYDKDKTLGHQYICEALDLKDISSNKYDFLISSHCLEHSANPLKALSEWLRVLKNNGILLIVLPDTKRTFDHNRPITSFEHVLKDSKENINEHDRTHVAEIIKSHDLGLDYQLNNNEDLFRLVNDNYNNRYLHQHTFDFALLIEIFDYLGLQIISVDYSEPMHLIIMGQKRNIKPSNEAYKLKYPRI